MEQTPRTSSKRVIVFSPAAESDQLNIYDSTAEFWGDEQADVYSNFLLDIAQLLAQSPANAPLVPNLPGVRVYIARWKNARQGHRIFFEETPEGINIIRILHTRMNWQEYLNRT